VDKDLRPLEKEVEETDRIDPDVMKALRARAVELGLYAHNLPTEVGGGGLTMVEQVVVAEELGRTTIPLSRIAGYLPALLTYCRPDQREWFLDPLVKGQKLVHYAVTEPDAGSDIGGMKTRAQQVNGSWVLNGGKCFVSNADLTDWLIIVAVTDPSAPLRGRFTLFIVDRKNPGFHFLRNIKKMGWRGSHFCQFSLEECKVPADCIIGEVNGGFELIMKAINETRVHLGGIYVGFGDEVLDHARKYAVERKTFGKRLADHEGIQFTLADIDCELAASHLLVYAAADAVDKKRPDMRIAASRAKYYAAEMAFRAADKVLQIFGAAGYSCDFPIERMFRDARAFRIGEGTSEIQRLQIARNLFR
jgi:acyl-CoA dehydrogenase